MIVAALEIIRLLRHQLRLSLLPFWLEVPIYLVMALVGVRVVARIGWGQIGFSRWHQWNATEKSYFVQVLILVGPLHYYYLFSTAALAVPMFAAIFAVGLLFAIVFHRTGNLWIVATMHAFGNAYAVGAVDFVQ